MSRPRPVRTLVASGQTTAFGRATIFGQALAATDPSWNRLIEPGGSVQVGFTGSWTGAFTPPSDFTLHGVNCERLDWREVPCEEPSPCSR